MSRMPKNWEPPYPSWICDLGTTTETIAVAYVGVQYPRSCDASREWATVLELTKSESGPASVTHRTTRLRLHTKIGCSELAPPRRAAYGCAWSRPTICV